MDEEPSVYLVSAKELPHFNLLIRSARCSDQLEVPSMVSQAQSLPSGAGWGERAVCLLGMG